ncbi:MULTISPECIES: hypothetical protein [Pseudoalteromonas]|uniref:hypothetical protein n=1 Tax=Pseudoalteromonas TaxID=53246 RepID=UPI00057A5B74|nr:MULTISPECIES: hypothetical protein [Pseudoalteromonas]ATG58884.1 hypothetical protein CPA52_11920 [Pseudoalteromonas marina]
MITHIVNKAFFKSPTGTSRLDAEYAELSLYKVEALLLTKGNAKPLINYCSSYSGPAISKDYSKAESLFRYIPIDAVDNQDGLIFPDELIFSERPSRAKYEVAEGDIIVSNVRPNRNTVALIGDRESKSIASSGYTLLKLNRAAPFTPEFLFVYLKTSYAIKQLLRRNRGSMYPAVVAEDIFTTVIPSFSSQFVSKITKKVKKGLIEKADFFQNLDKAEQKLNKFLKTYGAPPSPLESNKTGLDCTIVTRDSFYKTDGAMRFDAEFFRSEYVEFNSRVIENGSHFLLGEYYDLSPGSGLGKAKGEVVFFKQGCLSNYGINWASVGKEPGQLLENGSDVQEGDILLACTAHEIFYVGRKVDLVRGLPDELKDNKAVCDLLVIRAKVDKPASLPNSYVASFLRSDAGRHQVQRCIRGLRGGHVYARDLARFVRIPIPDKKLLVEYESLISVAELNKNKYTATIKGCIKDIEKHLDSL